MFVRSHICECMCDVFACPGRKPNSSPACGCPPHSLNCNEVDGIYQVIQQHPTTYAFHTPRDVVRLHAARMNSSASMPRSETLVIGFDGPHESGNTCNEQYGDDTIEFEELDVVGSDEVIRRIEDIVSCILSDAEHGSITQLQLLIPNGRFGAAAVNDQVADGSLASHPAQHTKMHSRCLLQNQGASALSYVRVIKVMEAVHGLLKANQQITQRDLYYKLQHPELFSSPAEVNSAVQDLISILRVPRSSLGLSCAARGAVSGSLLMKNAPGHVWQDCREVGPCGRSIPGDMQTLESICVKCFARYIIVIEKDAIFQKLTSDRIFDQVPCILITAKGMPDLATRVFLRNVHEHCPDAPVVGLVDWNPSGVAILCTYKFGNGRLALEASQYTVPTLLWLGIRSKDLGAADETMFSSMSARDRSMIASLSQKLIHYPGWLHELHTMENIGRKADIEAVYSTTGIVGFTTSIIESLVTRSWV